MERGTSRGSMLADAGGEEALKWQTCLPLCNFRYRDELQRTRPKPGGPKGYVLIIVR